MSSALAGIRVVDLSNRLSGAYAARLFGDYGADVFLVEDEQGHFLRSEPPFLDDTPGADSSLLHGYVNWNKHSVLASETDLTALLESADVVVTTGELDSSLTQILEKVPISAVHLSITPHGLTGPDADRKGNHLTHCARCGWASINRLQDDGPLQLPVRQTGYTAGSAGYVAGAAALFRCRRTGQGELVDVSELEAMASTNAPWAILGLFAGSERMQFGPAGPRYRGTPGPLWDTSNGAINFGFGDWIKWREAMTYLGLDEIATDERYEPVLGRHQQDLRPVAAGLAEAVSARDKWDIFHKLAELHCISGVVQNTRELCESEQLAARGFFTETEIGQKHVKAPGAAAKLYETPFTIRRSAPAMGECADASGERLTRPRHDESRAMPLAGVRVLTFTQAWSGTFATELLAFLGADVVQIEGRKRPDVWRGAGAPVPRAIRDPEKEQSPLNTNGMYNSVNLNKRAITLDMTDPKGREIFWRMVPNFDVVAENFSPKVMGNWGITMETLREKRPDIIFASLSGYGRQGPLAMYPANGATTEPMSGLTSIHGYREGHVMNTGGLYPDPVTGYYLAGAILTALMARQQTGSGQRIDSAMMEGVAVQVGDAILDYSANGRIQEPAGNRHPRFAPHGYFQTADESWFAIAAESEAMWQAIASSVDIDDRRFDTLEGRKQHEDDLERMISAWCAQRTAEEVASQFRDVDCCFAEVESFLDLYRSPNSQFLHRRYLREIEHPETGTHFLPTMPWRMAMTEQQEVRYSPCFGEHSLEVFQQELDMSDDEYQVLEKQGITGTTRL